MKKKQLKEELELANATLELSMVALRKLDEVLQEAKAQGFVPKNLNDKTEPQAGDKIVETNNSDWFTKNDDGTYTIKLSPNTKLFEWISKEDDSNVTGWNESTQNDFNEQEEIDRANYKEFKQRDKESKKETPLADLNKEVQDELEKSKNGQQFETLKVGQEIEFTLMNGKTYKTKVEKNSCNLYQLSCYPEYSREDCPFESLNQIEFKDQLNKKYGTSMWPNTPTLEDLTNDLNKLITLPDLSCKSTDSTNCESYVIQAKEAVDKFMPLVNGWVKCQPFAEGSKIFEHEGNGHIDQSFWKWNIVNYRKAAIKVAIAHFELIQNQGGWLTHIDCVQIIGELNKMLAS